MAKSGNNIKGKGSPRTDSAVKSYRQSKQKLRQLRQNLLERERKSQELQRRQRRIKTLKNVVALSSSVALLVMTYYFIF